MFQSILKFSPDTEFNLNKNITSHIMYPLKSQNVPQFGKTCFKQSSSQNLIILFFLLHNAVNADTDWHSWQFCPLKQHFSKGRNLNLSSEFILIVIKF